MVLLPFVGSFLRNRSTLIRRSVSSTSSMKMTTINVPPPLSSAPALTPRAAARKLEQTCAKVEKLRLRVNAANATLLTLENDCARFEAQTITGMKRIAIEWLDSAMKKSTLPEMVVLTLKEKLESRPIITIEYAKVFALKKWREDVVSIKYRYDGKDVVATRKCCGFMDRSRLLGHKMGVNSVAVSIEPRAFLDFMYASFFLDSLVNLTSPVEAGLGFLEWDLFEQSHSKDVAGELNAVARMLPAVLAAKTSLLLQREHLDDSDTGITDPPSG